MSHKTEATVLIQAKAGKAEELKSAMQELIDETLKEPGCELFKIFQHDGNPEAFTLWEIFSNPSALKEHMDKSYTQKFFSLGLTEPLSAIHHAQLSR
ncbi:putative quinol monooxygenase [Budvicia aquatica]|uniref:Antibiotic biosynthesis monooxygenase n=1 Tax=Budvicia aquatica TaxID=82979 RepID=A0A2C6DDZ4_9GAMM|nr:antibiotic biosynthesis monooxygenase [Budvicia aquatica]PHI29416.1 antibiotic biosynthesis monooxygenase [Budvicia aquatica]